MNLSYRKWVGWLIDSRRTDAWIHPTLHDAADPLEAARAKLLFAFSVGVFFLGPAIAAPYFEIGVAWLGWMTLGNAAMLGSAALWLRVTGSLWLSVNVLCLGLLSGTVTGFGVMGGVQSPSILFHSVIPVFAYLFGSARLGLMWFGVCLCATLGMAWASAAGVVTPSQVFSPGKFEEVWWTNMIVFSIAMLQMIATSDALRAWLVLRTHRQESRVKMMVGSAADGIVVFGPEDEVVLANSVARELVPDLEALAEERREAFVLSRQARELRVSSASGEDGERVMIVRDETVLRRALDQAQVASQAKSAFLARMSHELRTPLTTILGYTELLQEESGEETPELSCVHSAATELLEIVTAALDVTSAERGELEAQAFVFGLEGLVEEVSSQARRGIEEGGNVFAVEVGSDVEMRTDRGKLKRALMAILRNAGKFTSDGEVGLCVTERDGFVTFEIRDSGTGMGPEEQSLMFEEFWQADASSTRERDGAGLGLAMVEKTMTLLGGEIEVESQRGEGTMFRVRVPVTLG